MIVGKQSLTLKCLDRVFSLKNFFGKTPFIFIFYNFVGNEGLYSIGKGMWKGTLKFIRQTVSWVTRKLAWVANDSQNLAWQRLFKFQHVLLTWPFYELVFTSQSQASHEFFIFTESSPISHTQPLHYIPQKYREMIEQNYNQIWHEINTNIKT